jgi:hypothetical protein
MEAAYYQAAEPRRRRILGQTLEPFSLGHAHLLAAGRNPFCPFTGDPSLQDDQALIDAVFICAHHYEGAKKALHSRWLFRRLKLWGRSCRHLDFDIERQLFQRYLAEASTLPRIWTGAGRQLGAPTLLLLRQHLRWTRQLAPDVVMNTPVGEAIWDYLAFHEQHGRLQIWTAEDYELWNLQKELEAENAARKGGA